MDRRPPQYAIEALSHARAETLHAAALRGGRITPAQLSDDLGISRSVAHSRLTSLHIRGLMVQEGYGEPYVINAESIREVVEWLAEVTEVTL